MAVTCSVYGLGLHVNVPLAGLSGLPAAEQIDVNITLGSMPPGLEARSGGAHDFYISADLNEDGVPVFRVSRLPDSNHYLIAYCDGTMIVVDDLGRRVWATWPESLTVEDTATYLLGPILGVVLRLRGVTCLHASAVAVDDKAIALVGTSGAGKSSTAAAFARLGFPVLSDDVVALTDLGDGFAVQPAYPRIRLWPESVASLFGSADALPRITTNWDKCFLDLNSPGYRFQREPMPLAAVYFLGERCTSAVEHRIVAEIPRLGLMTLVSDTYATNFQDKPRRAKEFELLGRLVENVPLRRVTPSSDFARIPDLCAAIVADLRQLML